MNISEMSDELRKRDLVIEKLESRVKALEDKLNPSSIEEDEDESIVDEWVAEYYAQNPNVDT